MPSTKPQRWKVDPSLPSPAPDVRFGRLTVLHREAPTGREKGRWACECDCGQRRVVRGTSLRSGVTTSCGCLRDERLRVSRARQSQHLPFQGAASTPEYKSWMAMILRCENPRDPSYPRYGGRGIKVCASWSRSFAAFWSDMGPRPSLDMSLDRIDNEGNYEPGNCRWASKQEQQRNKRNNRWIEAFGQRLTMAEWTARLGVSRATIGYRIQHGWSVEDAVSVPRLRG